MNAEESKKAADMFEKICKQALEEIDLLASYQHYIIFDEIKIVYKTKNGMRND